MSISENTFPQAEIPIITLCNCSQNLQVHMLIVNQYTHLVLAISFCIFILKHQVHFHTNGKMMNDDSLCKVKLYFGPLTGKDSYSGFTLYEEASQTIHLLWKHLQKGEMYCWIC